MAQKIEAKNERPLQSFWLKNFLAVNTNSARIAEPQPSCFYDLTNAQPIGFSNLHAVADVSAPLFDYGAHHIYAAWGININGQETIISAATDGTLWAWYIGQSGAASQIGAGLSGTDALDIAQYDNNSILIIDTSGYYYWPRVVSVPGGTRETDIIRITGNGAPASGQCIAVYADMVWIGQGRTLFYSKAGLASDTPPAFMDFTTANGGGFTNINDSTLRSAIKALFAANGYLYLFGESNVDAISDVYVPSGATTPTPSFTRLNISAIVGTDQTHSIMVYGRLVLFANRMGAWMLYGTTVQSISSNDAENSYLSSIDGTWQYLDFLTFRSSGGQVMSNRLLCAAFLVSRLNDPHMGSGNFLAIYQADAAGAKWWFADTTTDVGPLTLVCTAFVNNAPALFGYIGNVLYQVFANEASALSARIMTALWDFEDPLSDKQAIRAGIRISIRGTVNPAVAVNIDTLSNSFPMPLRDIGSVDWINNTEQSINWQNSALQIVVWNNQTENYLLYFGKAPECYSKYLGFTVTTKRQTLFELNEFLLDYKLGARWVGG